MKDGMNMRNMITIMIIMSLMVSLTACGKAPQNMSSVVPAEKVEIQNDHCYSYDGMMFRVIDYVSDSEVSVKDIALDTYKMDFSFGTQGISEIDCITYEDGVKRYSARR
jgi:hypothetical protein